MIDMMLATTGNSTSIHFGMGHMCGKHKTLFTLDHVERCDSLTGCENIRKYANKLREQHILDWDREERLNAISAFALLTIQMKNLTEQKQATLVQTQPPSAYIKTGRKRGRPSKKELIARSNHTINQFYTPANGA